MSDVDRKLKPITHAVLDRVRRAKAEEEPNPEWRLFIRESRLRMAESLLYDVFPEGVARFLGRALPSNESIKRVLQVWDFRAEHGFPGGYIPAGYNLPPKDQG